jgi:hypothetical protein
VIVELEEVYKTDPKGLIQKYLLQILAQDRSLCNRALQNRELQKLDRGTIYKKQHKHKKKSILVSIISW